MVLKRALTVKNVIDKKYKLLPFEAEWCDAFSQPEARGTWLIWGNSGNGKTNFVLQLIAELVKYEKVLLNSREEGTSYSLQQGLLKSGISEFENNLLIVNEDAHQLQARLQKRNSPEIVVIDSFQYMQMNYRDYLQFSEALDSKLKIFISHADGKFPAGRSAKSVMYDADLKIYVEGYKAFSKGRYIGTTGQYTIWKEGAEAYWGEINDN